MQDPDHFILDVQKFDGEIVSVEQVNDQFIICTHTQILQVQQFQQAQLLHKIEDKNVIIKEAAPARSRLYALLSNGQIIQYNVASRRIILIKTLNGTTCFSSYCDAGLDRIISIQQLDKSATITLLTVGSEGELDPICVKINTMLKMKCIKDFQMKQGAACVIVETDKVIVSINILDGVANMLEPITDIATLHYCQITTADKQAASDKLFPNFEKLGILQQYPHIALMCKATDRTVASEISNVSVDCFASETFGELQFIGPDQMLTRQFQTNQTTEQISAIIRKTLYNPTKQMVQYRDQMMAESTVEYQQFIEQIYGSTTQKMEDAIYFACLRSSALFEVLSQYLKIQESRVTAQNQNVHVVYNVRPLAQMCQTLIICAIQILVQAHSTFSKLQLQNGADRQLNEEFATYQNLLKNLEVPVENSVKVLQLLASTRPQAFDELRQKADLAAVRGTVFVGMSRFFVQLVEKQWDVFNVQYPEAGRGSGFNYIYDEAFGYFDHDVLQKVQRDTTNAGAFLELSSEQNTSSYIFVAKICSLFKINFEKFSISQVFEYLVQYLQQLETVNTNLVEIKEIFEKTFDVLRIMFCFTLIRAEEDHSRIYQQLKDLSIDQDKVESLYFIARLTCELDFGEVKQYQDTNKLQAQFGGPDSLFNALLLLGQNVEQQQDVLNVRRFFTAQDLGEIEMKIASALQLLGYQDLPIRLTHIAAQIKNFTLALSLSQFCPTDEVILNESEIYPSHPCQSQYETLVRILLLKHQATGNSQPLVQAVRFVKTFFKNVRAHMLLNQRMAILLSQMLLNKIKFEIIRPAEERQNLSVSVSQYNNDVGAKADQMQQLMLHQSFTPAEKSGVLGYCVMNQVSLGFAISFLFNQDLPLCLRFLMHLKQQRELSEKTMQAMQLVESRLEKLPKFLVSNKNEPFEIQDELDDALTDPDYAADKKPTNQLQFSMSIIQQPDEVPILVNKKPQELNLLRDAIQQMNHGQQPSSQQYDAKPGEYRPQQMANYNQYLPVNNQYGPTQPVRQMQSAQPQQQPFQAAIGPGGAKVTRAYELKLKQMAEKRAQAEPRQVQLPPTNPVPARQYGGYGQKPVAPKQPLYPAQNAMYQPVQQQQQPVYNQQNYGYQPQNIYAAQKPADVYGVNKAPDVYDNYQSVVHQPVNKFQFKQPAVYNQQMQRPEDQPIRTKFTTGGGYPDYQDEVPVNQVQPVGRPSILKNAMGRMAVSPTVPAAAQKQKGVVFNIE